MPLGARETVAIGPAGSISLLRGVSQNEWAVSVWAHGPVPLASATVLGENSTLYPAKDTGLAGPRIPFGAGGDIQTDACSRWELQATGLTDQQLADYAARIRPVAAPTRSCPASALTVRLAKSASAYGFTGLLFAVTNRGNVACDLTGYPQIAMMDRGRPVASAVIGGGYSYLDPGPQVVRVDPGERASFGLTVGGFAPNLPCQPADSIQITMPDGRSSLTTVVPSQGCYTDDVRVTAFVAGSAGPPTH